MEITKSDCNRPTLQDEIILASGTLAYFGPSDCSRTFLTLETLIFLAPLGNQSGSNCFSLLADSKKMVVDNYTHIIRD